MLGHREESGVPKGNRTYVDAQTPREKWRLSPEAIRRLHESELAELGELFNEADVIRNIKTLLM